MTSTLLIPGTMGIVAATAFITGIIYQKKVAVEKQQ